MTHEFSGALQELGRIPQGGALEETHVYVRSKDIDVAEGRIAQTCDRTAVMQEFPHFVPAFSHCLEPSLCNGSQFACVLFEPCIDGWIAFDGTVEPQ